MNLGEKLDYAEAAVFTTYSIQYLRKLVSRRKIPFYKFGGNRVFFDRQELERWMAARIVHYETI